MEVGSLLLVHSPLVGPSSVRRLAAAAIATGVTATAPDLTAAVSADEPHRRYVDAAVAAADGLPPPVLVVGHSGAGVFLPAIGSGVGADRGLIFLDAVVPTTAGAHRTPPEMHELLDRQTVDGSLQPWLAWWPAEVVARLLPDPADRAELAADLPRVPRGFYDVDVQVPAGWSDRRCGYVQLSAAYATDADEARTRGWPATELDSSHLGPHTEPGRVLAAVLDVAHRI